MKASDIVRPISLIGISGLIVLSASVISGCGGRGPRTDSTQPAANLPFRPEVTYSSSNVTIFNSEHEPYLDTSVNLYVDGTLFSLKIGTIGPGGSVSRALRSLTNERGESYEPNSGRTSELEVRARFGGYDVHKDFPPPPQ